jgi:hypothetical protein
MFDSSLGRFIGRDARRAAAAANVYEYAADNPANQEDPAGLEAKSPKEIAELLMKRYYDQLNPLTVFKMAFLGAKPENTDSYKQLKLALDQIRAACKKVPALPPGLLGPCGLALPGLISDLVAKLGAKEFGVREQATKDLTSILPFAIDALRGAAGSNDPEVAVRAERLIARFEWNCFRQAFRAVPAENRMKLVALIMAMPGAFPDGFAIAGVFIEEGTPVPPPPKPAPAAPPPPPVPPAAPPAIIA